MPKKWVKSSLSFSNGNCVELEFQPDGSVKMRNSRDKRGPILHFTAAEWDAFVGGAKLGEFDHIGTDDGRPHPCLCGYPASSEDDLEQHIVASMHGGRFDSLAYSRTGAGG